MKRRTEIVDETFVVFRANVVRRKRMYVPQGFEKGPDKTLLRRVKFPSWNNALAYITALELKFDPDMRDYTDSWFGNYGEKWKPIRITRRIQRPGKGTVVFEKKLVEDG